MLTTVTLDSWQRVTLDSWKCWQQVTLDSWKCWQQVTLGSWKCSQRVTLEIVENVDNGIVDNDRCDTLKNILFPSVRACAPEGAKVRDYLGGGGAAGEGGGAWEVCSGEKAVKEGEEEEETIQVCFLHHMVAEKLIKQVIFSDRKAWTSTLYLIIAEARPTTSKTPRVIIPVR